MWSVFSWLRSRRSTEKEPSAPPFDPKVYHLTPRPLQIIEDLAVNRAARDEVLADYIGLRVQWMTILRKAIRKPDGSIELVLDDRGRVTPPSIQTQVWAAEYPLLAGVLPGTRIWIAGRVEDVLPTGIALADVRLHIVQSQA